MRGAKAAMQIALLAGGSMGEERERGSGGLGFDPAPLGGLGQSLPEPFCT